MTGAEAQKLAAEGQWVRRKSWIMSWPWQFVTHVDCLADEAGLDYWNDFLLTVWECKTGFVRFEVQGFFNTDDGSQRVSNAEYILQDLADWDADDWESFDRSTIDLNDWQ